MVTTNEQLFDSWFASNYGLLKANLCPTNLYGELYSLTSEDVFHNAYLLARESVLGKETNEFEFVFYAAYRRQNKKQWYRFNHQKEIRPSDLFWSLLKVDENERTEEQKAKRYKLVSDIIRWAKVSFSADEYNVFKMYFNNGFSEYDIADYYGVCVRAINKRLGSMKAMVCARFEDEFKYL
jgi:hypothetical protein